MSEPASGQAIHPLAPPAGSFPKYPSSWYLFGTARELRRGPVSKQLLGRRLVCYRTSRRRLVMLDARCSHLGADLGRGQVIGENIQCPFHHWEYGTDGRCAHIPVSVEIPATAQQACYPVVERHGFVYFFNSADARFPLPFFADVEPDELVPARPFGTVLHCPWYMVGSNAFDLQHFRAAHDRRLVGDPVVDCPSKFARRATARFSVAGDSLQDRLTRWFAGDTVEMSITDWCGNLMLATATFRRTRSYGMVITEPRDSGEVAVRVIVFVPRSRSQVGRIVCDPIHAWVRRFFIKNFLSSDAMRLDGAIYNPHSLIAWDKDLADYFRWLSGVAAGASVNTPCDAPMQGPARQSCVRVCA